MMVQKCVEATNSAYLNSQTQVNQNASISISQFLYPMSKTPNRFIMDASGSNGVWALAVAGFKHS